ncbi:hypothetical protein [Clostridium sporogenes]|uniref:hypothetical protein n=1 Tax=Clostridium sporogenes TaxID=1509 RepID=UPI0013D859A2|nr:hypothetical protein [Clostridium sporogenes]MCW6124312.1 hypothetical protein [Clostridium sporogenes]NFT27058.1 hypothetical protein [Clostridium sporogenes]
MDWKKEYALRCKDKELTKDLIMDSIKKLKKELITTFNKYDVKFKMDISNESVIINERVIELNFQSDEFSFYYHRDIDIEISPEKHAQLCLNGEKYEYKLTRSDKKKNVEDEVYFLDDAIDRIFQFLLSNNDD